MTGQAEKERKGERNGDGKGRGRTLRVDVYRAFEKVTGVVSAAILLIVAVSLVVGVVQLVATMGGMLAHRALGKDYLELISEVLTLFILIELSRSLAEYFRVKRLRLTFITDAAIVFVLREIMIQLFEHKLPAAQIYALSVLLLVMALLRVLFHWMHQRQAGEERSLGGAGSRPGR